MAEGNDLMNELIDIIRERRHEELDAILRFYYLEGVPLSTLAFEMNMPGYMIDELKIYIDTFYRANAKSWLTRLSPIKLTVCDEDIADYERIADELAYEKITLEEATEKLAECLRLRRNRAYRSELENVMDTVRRNDIEDFSIIHKLSALVKPFYCIVDGETEFVAVPARMAEEFFKKMEGDI